MSFNKEYNALRIAKYSSQVKGANMNKKDISHSDALPHLAAFKSARTSRHACAHHPLNRPVHDGMMCDSDRGLEDCRTSGLSEVFDEAVMVS